MTIDARQSTQSTAAPGRRSVVPAMRIIAAIIAVIASMELGGRVAMAAISDPVRIETGLVQGTPTRDPSIMVFKDIPYAAPLVRDLRWRAPQSPAPWSGVRKADQFGASCH